MSKDADLLRAYRTVIPPELRPVKNAGRTLTPLISKLGGLWGNRVVKNVRLVSTPAEVAIAALSVAGGVLPGG